MSEERGGPAAVRAALEKATWEGWTHPLVEVTVPTVEVQALLDCAEVLLRLVRRTPFEPAADGIRVLLTFEQIAEQQAALRKAGLLDGD